MKTTLLPDPRRRLLLAAGGGLVLASFWHGKPAAAAEVVEIGMGGSGDGVRVWFRPRAILVKAGQTIRWTNNETGNVHTATAYHPSNNGKPQRIPNGAKPWNSDYLMPGKSFEVKLDVPGVYDYYCVPHEMAGMVGRIIVVGPDAEAEALRQASDAKLPPAAVQAFVSIQEIMQKHTVE